jgi:predicted MFS family arabinose efflux permease
MEQIMVQFSIDASLFGLLAAFYYYGYAGMQIPVAIFLNKFGAKKVICTSAVICGMAAFLFSYTDNFYLALLSRFIIGGCSAVGFLGVSKVITEWFSQKNYSTLVGLSFSFGLLGAIFGGKPVGLLVTQYDWQNVAMALSAISIAIGLTIYILLRSPENKNTHNDEKEEEFKLSKLFKLLSSPGIWGLALVNFLLVGSLEGFADVWGIPYLTTAYGIAKSDAAGLVSLVYIGMLFGGPLLALLARSIGNFSVISLCGIGMALAFAILFNMGGYNSTLFGALFFAIGIMCCYQVIIFAAGSGMVSKSYLGVTVAFLNCVNMLGGSFFHTFIGKIMEHFWVGSLNAEGMKLYSLEAYSYAIGLIPVCSIIGAFLMMSMQLKKRRQKTAPEFENVAVQKA